jgi:adenylate kinase
MRITIIGGPAAGKSTLTERLVRNCPAVTVFGVRRHFAEQVAAGTDIGCRSRSFVEAQTWIPDELVIEALAREIDERLGREFILEGVPATAGQAALLDQALRTRDLPLDIAVHVAVENDVAVARAEQRLVCLSCDGGSHPAHIDAEGRCASCETPVTARPTDTGPGFNRRLELTRRHLPGLLAHYRPDRLLEVDGTNSPDQVLTQVLEQLRAVRANRS